MARNLIICCDGTSNEFGSRNTNVVRLLQSLDGSSSDQRVYYDPGVGTMPGAGWKTQLGKKYSQVLDLAIASGLEEKIEHGYRALMNSWRPGDRVFIFGFSRGAYTARVLAGMLHSIGLLPPHSENLIPYAIRLFIGIRAERRQRSGRETYFDLADRFRQTFAQSMPGRTDRRFGTHFLGIWDTVSSVGLPWEERTYGFTATNPSIQHIRHAVALDERRAFFRQNLVHETAGQDVKERWFAGYHCDVGGGYVDAESGVSAAALAWMAHEAQDAGVQFDKAALAAAIGTTDGQPSWKQPRHESLKGLWLLAELVPKPTYDWSTGRTRWLPNLGHSRDVRAGAMMHESLLLRLYHDRSYAPRNLSPTFVEQLRGAPAPTGDAAYLMEQ